MNFILRRSFCTAKSQLSRHGYLAFPRNGVLTGAIIGGAAGAGLLGTIYLQSSEINTLSAKLLTKTSELKQANEDHETLTIKSNREKTKLEATVSEKEGVISEKESVISEKESVISEKESALDDAKSAIENKVQALNAQDFILTQTKQKLNETSNQHARLQRRHKDLKSVKTKLTGDLTNCVKTRETTVERIKREKKELENSYAALNTRANNLETIIGDLRSELRSKHSH